MREENKYIVSSGVLIGLGIANAVVLTLGVGILPWLNWIAIVGCTLMGALHVAHWRGYTLDA